MFSLGILIGIFSYIIFALGLLGIFYKPLIIFLTIFYILIASSYYRLSIKMNLLRCFETSKKVHRFFSLDKLFQLMIILLFLQGIINLIGALGPELGFDALWYHLTLSKIYLTSHYIDYIRGGLLYYSAMPKLTEMLYAGGLAFGSEIFAKLIHFSFGILCLVALYKLSRKFFSTKLSLIVITIFYSNLVVGWMSIAAYVDLARTFFEIMALWGFVNFAEKVEPLSRFHLGRYKWLIESAVMLGLAISTKLLAIGSLLIFSVLIITYFLYKKKLKHLLIALFTFWSISMLISLPWFIFSYIHTGNPIYPFFENIYPVNFSFNYINPLNLSDPINPLFIILIPIAFLLFNKQKSKLKVISVYSALAFLVWQLTPNTGGGRFLLPYLPAFSMLSVWVIREIWKLKIRPIILGFVIFFSLISIFYRIGANLKYIPVIIGIQSKSDFLEKNLNFSFGDFYDADGFFMKNIKPSDTVLLYGFHNLYYIDFPFIDSSWAKKGDRFNYIAIQNSIKPERFKNWNLIYYSSKTNVKVYSLGGIKWTY